MTGIVGPVSVETPIPENHPAPETLCLYEGETFTGARLTLSSVDPAGTYVSLVDHGRAWRVHSALNTPGSSTAPFPERRLHR